MMFGTQKGLTKLWHDHAEEKLVGYAGREGGVEDYGIVLYVDGGFLEIIREV